MKQLYDNPTFPTTQLIAETETRIHYLRGSLRLLGLTVVLPGLLGGCQRENNAEGSALESHHARFMLQSGEYTVLIKGASVEQPVIVKTVFKVDTETGKSWRMIATSEGPAYWSEIDEQAANKKAN